MRSSVKGRKSLSLICAIFHDAPETTPADASYDLEAYGLMENFEVATQASIR